MNRKYKLHKVTGLPVTPEANAIYFLSVGTKFQLHVTNSAGTARTIDILDEYINSVSWSKVTGVPNSSSAVSGVVRLGSDTVQTVAANAVSTTSARTYSSQVNAAGQIVVNVPWTDTVYSHPTQSAIDTGVLTGALVPSRVVVDTLGHVTSISTRSLTPADIGAAPATGGSYLPLAGGTLTGALIGTTATFSGVVSGSNFHDANGVFNVNLGGAQGRGIVAGYSGGSYGGLGYNIRHTTTNATWIAPTSDTVSYLMLHNGLSIHYAPTGTSGRTLTTIEMPLVFRVDGPTGTVHAAKYINTTSSTFSAFTADGQFQIFSSSLSGVVITGRGSTNDINLANRNGANVLTIPTGTTNVAIAGAATATSFNGITGLATVAPLANGTAAVGTSTLAARQDHVHPTDTSRAAVNQIMFIGTTSFAINRASAAQTLTGVSIDGNAATATSTQLLDDLNDYSWASATLPTSYPRGMQLSFVGPSVGEGSWQNYGSVITARTYSGGGGSLQMYVPYGPSNGGNALQVRFGNYSVSGGNSWTAWKTLLQSDNFDTYAASLTGSYSNPAWITSLAWSKLTGVPTATSTTLGLVELFSDTVQGVTANAVSATASRTYGVQLNAAGQMVVNVPWVDTDTIYTHPTQSAIDTGTLSGAVVVSRVNVNTLGHTTVVSTRSLTPTDIGAAPATGGSYVAKAGDTMTGPLVGTTFEYTGSATTSSPIDTGFTKARISAADIGGAALTLIADSFGRGLRVASNTLGVIGTFDVNSSEGGNVCIASNTAHPLIFKTGAATAFTLAHGGLATFTNNVTAPTFIGALSGNATTASRLVNAGVTNVNTGRTAGSLEFYDVENATGAPNSGWFNYISTRHGNVANQNGFQLANQFTTEALWFRGWDGTNPLPWRTVWHSGNLTNLNQLANGPGYITASSLSAYLPLAGGIMTGKITTLSTGADHYGGAIEIRERGYVLATESLWSFSPAITFHWGNRFGKRFGMRSDGLFAVDDEPLALRSWVTSQGYTGNTGTVTSVAGTGNVSGITLSGTVTSSGSLTLGGTLTLTAAQVNAVGTISNSTTGNAATASSVPWSGVTSKPTTLPGYGVTALSVNPSMAANTPNGFTSTGITYTTGVSLFGQSDGALYANAYSTAWQHQIFGDYRSGQLAVRGCSMNEWGAWRTVLDSSNFNSYSPTLTGGGASGSWNINALTAGTWQTARNFTIGGTTKSVNGSTSVSWSLAEIGVAESSSAVYTPSFAAIINITGSPTYQYASYTKIGNLVTVYCSFAVSASAAGWTVLEIGVPLTNSDPGSFTLTGTAYNSNGGIMPIRISSTSTSTVYAGFNATGAETHYMDITFRYWRDAP